MKEQKKSRFKGWRISILVKEPQEKIRTPIFIQEPQENQNKNLCTRTVAKQIFNNLESQSQKKNRSIFCQDHLYLVTVQIELNYKRFTAARRVGDIRTTARLCTILSYVFQPLMASQKRGKCSNTYCARYDYWSRR